MGWNAAALQIAGSALRSAVDKISAHGGAPGASGTANEITGGGYARLTPTWTASSEGDWSLSAPLDFSGPASDPVTHIGLWNGSTYLGDKQLTGDQAFNAAGVYRVTSITNDSSSPS